MMSTTPDDQPEADSALDMTPSPLEQLRRQAAQRADYLDLSSSNPTLHGFIFPAGVLEECAAAYWPSRRYQPDPKGSLRAREAIARYYAQRTPPLSVSPQRIFITASTSEAYLLLFNLLAAPGDNVLAPVPGYPLFAHLAALRQIVLRPYTLALAPDSDRGLADAGHAAPQWQLEGAQWARRVNPRTRALLIISPHNPTGHVVAGHLPELHALGLPVIADEVFCEFPFALDHVPPLGALHPEATVFHLNGISKMFALPDLKLGWIAISGPQAEQYLERLELLNDTLLGANSLTQFMLPELFERGLAFTRAMRGHIQDNLKQALDRLGSSERVRVAAPLGGAYLFPQIRGCGDEDALLAQMLAAGLFAHPGYFYDSERGCYLMLSALMEGPRLMEGIERLVRVIESVVMPGHAQV